MGQTLSSFSWLRGKGNQFEVADVLLTQGVIKVADWSIRNGAIPSIPPVNWFHCDGRYVFGFSTGKLYILLTALDCYNNIYRTIKLRARFGVGNGNGLPLRCDEYQVFVKSIDGHSYLILFCYQLDRNVNVINGIINFNHGCANGRLRNKFNLGAFHGPTNPEFYFIPERSKLLVVTSTPAYSLYLHVYDVHELEMKFRTTVTDLPDFYLEFVHLNEHDDVLYFVPSESATLDCLESVNIWTGKRESLTIDKPPSAVTNALRTSAYSGKWYQQWFLFYAPAASKKHSALYTLNVLNGSWMEIRLPASTNMSAELGRRGLVHMAAGDDGFVTLRWHQRDRTSAGHSRHVLYRTPYRQPDSLLNMAFFALKNNNLLPTASLPQNFRLRQTMRPSAPPPPPIARGTKRRSDVSPCSEGMKYKLRCTSQRQSFVAITNVCR